MSEQAEIDLRKVLGKASALARENERLRAALKPFAQAGRTLLDEPDETGVIIKDPITVGDFRRAAEAFQNEQSARPMMAAEDAAMRQATLDSSEPAEDKP
jgi:hypothetical protein